MGTNGRFVLTSAIAGIIAGMVMAMYAMVASATFLGQGLFSPLYGIASPLVGQQALMTSMHQGVYFTLGPAIVGLIIHMMWSAVYGVVFGLIVRALHIQGAMAVGAGMLYGIVILLVMSFIVLPIVGAGSMPAMVGWPSFTIEHLMFGVALGLWPIVRPRDFTASAPTHVSARTA